MSFCNHSAYKSVNVFDSWNTCPIIRKRCLTNPVLHTITNNDITIHPWYNEIIMYDSKTKDNVREEPLMPEGTYTQELHIPRATVWDFIKDMDHWAPLVPGYITHHIRDEKQSTWKFKGDLGFIQKKINMRVDITEWKEPSLVTFDLTGLNEKFSGNGYFKTEEKSDSTNVTGHLAITAKGLKGALINSVLKTFVPNLTRELTTNISDKLQALQSADDS